MAFLNKAATALALVVGLMVSLPAVGTTPARLCKPISAQQVRCTLHTVADCQAVYDYPYARNLFCPASFRAARTMAQTVATALGVRAPRRSVLYYFQTHPDPDTPPDRQAQTAVACLDTPSPWNPTVVLGGGVPLCHLVAYAMSLGPVGRQPHRESRNPLPDNLRSFPRFLSNLFTPSPALPLTGFRSGSPIHDPVVKALGSAGVTGFLADYPSFSPTVVYDPAQWRALAEYQGISGGGGGGWGGELRLATRQGTRVLLAFGGGGGGGMTAQRESLNHQARAALGAGGGGGMQFANGYRQAGRSYNGLGLGAGHSHAEATVQYSYNQDLQTTTHDYSPTTIAVYQAQLRHLKRRLKARYRQGHKLILTGGGGMGGGMEYLRANGQAYTPHALSTQAGFAYRYEFYWRGSGLPQPRTQAAGETTAMQESPPDLYQALGDFYRIAHQQAYQDCGNDYANFGCICPRAQALVICQAGHFFAGEVSRIPAWLQQAHCPDTTPPPLTAGVAKPPNPPDLTRYQRLLQAALQGQTTNLGPPRLAVSPQQCTQLLLAYFATLNTPQ